MKASSGICLYTFLYFCLYFSDVGHKIVDEHSSTWDFGGPVLGEYYHFCNTCLDKFRKISE